MEFTSINYLLWVSLFLPLVWISTPKYIAYIIAIFGLIFIAINAPIAASVLITETLLCYIIFIPRKTRKWIATVFYICIVFSAFLLCKYYASKGLIILPLGISYFTFRLIHYAQERIRKNIRQHSLIEFFSYMTFFPTYLVGPINLFPEFLQNLRRRSWNSAIFSKGLERMIYGYAQLIILGNFVVNHLIKNWILSHSISSGKYGELFIQPTLMWLDLYIRFSAYSSIAIGLSLMAGFKVQENFNYPFFASNIREFWQRWHISLTEWCRNYIFVPIAAVTRRPYIAIGVTMITIGIWHELSIRYILWGLYHSIGIIIYGYWSAFFSDKLPKSRLFQKTYHIIGVLTTIVFVVLSFPLTKLLSNYINSLFI